MDNNQTHKRTHRFVAVELNNLIAMRPKRKLHTCDLQQCCRNLLQRLLFAAESKGKQYSDVIKQILLEAQISIPDRTRRRYLKKARTGQLAVDYSFNSGRPPKLTLDHELLVVGFISDAINRRKPVNNVAVQSFIEQRFGESLSLKQVTRITSKHGFSSQKTTSKAGGFSELVRDLATVYYNFLKDDVHPALASASASQVGSLDITYTTYRTHQPIALGRKGG